MNYVRIFYTATQYHDYVWYCPVSQVARRVLHLLNEIEKDALHYRILATSGSVGASEPQDLRAISTSEKQHDADVSLPRLSTVKKEEESK